MTDFQCAQPEAELDLTPIGWIASARIAGSPEDPPEWDTVCVAGDTKPDDRHSWEPVYSGTQLRQYGASRFYAGGHYARQAAAIPAPEGAELTDICIQAMPEVRKALVAYFHRPMDIEAAEVVRRVRDALAAQRPVSALDGMEIVIDDTIPPDELHVVQDGKVAQVVKVGMPEAAPAPCAAEGDGLAQALELFINPCCADPQCSNSSCRVVRAREALAAYRATKPQPKGTHAELIATLRTLGRDDVLNGLVERKVLRGDERESIEAIQAAAMRAAAALAAEPAQSPAPAPEVPDGYKLVMVPDELPGGEPDWDEVRRQAEVSTGLKVGPEFSILIREVRRWLAHRASQAPAVGAEVPRRLIDDSDFGWTG